LPEVLEMPDELSPTMRALLAPLRAHWQAQDSEIAALDQHILIIARPYSGARLLMTIPDMGTLIATPWSPPATTARRLGAPAIAPAGSVWCRGSMRAAARRGSSGFPNAATALSGGSW
jgi:hypothetical protein